jgi:hypothetical protein
MPFQRVNTRKRTDYEERLKHRPLKTGAPAPDEEVVWWFGGVLKGKPGTQPTVVTWLREIRNGALTSGYRSIRVPVAELAHFPLGSIWRNGSSVSSIWRDEAVFGVNFSEQGWECFQPGADMGALIPENVYPLFNSHRDELAFLLRFKARTAAGDIELLIPSFEFFVRMFGASGYVRRVLCTFPWDQGKDMLTRPLPEGMPKEKWAVNLHRRSLNADVVFLAHLLYDQYALERAKSIWSDLEGSLPHPTSNEYFIPIRPWMRGPGALRIRGVWLRNGKSFLGLRIIGASQPSGTDIQRDRENTNRVGPLAPDAIRGAAWRGVARNLRLPEIVDITDASLPESGLDTVIVEDEPLAILGEPRVVVDFRRNEAKSTSGSISGSREAERYSSDEPRSAATGVGGATFVADPKVESYGVLRDVWNYLLILRHSNPGFILSVDCMASQGQFVGGDEPSMIPFAPFTAEEIKHREPKNRKWPYIDPKAMTPRGALIARVGTPSTDVYFLEIQRRVLASRGDGDSETEENFKGVVFTTANPQSAFNWASSVMREIRFSGGAGLEKHADPPGGIARAFVHRPSRQEEHQQETAIRRAFRLVGVDLPT